MPTETCPSCGSGAARPVTPNLRECQGKVLHDVIPAGAQGNVSSVPLYRTCGNRYQVAAPGQVGLQACMCGLDSIGMCTECGQRLCGDHVVKHAGQVLCPSHADAAARADAAAQKVRDERATAAQGEEMASWERKAAAALNALPDPVERAVRLLAAQLPHIHGPELAELMRAAEQLTVADIAAWFLRSVTMPPGEVEVREPHWLTGNPKWKKQRGWTFESTTSAPSSNMGTGGYRDVTLLTDGRLFFGLEGALPPAVRLSPRGLHSMLKMVSARPLGLGTRPYRPLDYHSNPGDPTSRYDFDAAARGYEYRPTIP